MQELQGDHRGLRTALGRLAVCFVAVALSTCLLGANEAKSTEPDLQLWFSVGGSESRTRVILMDISVAVRNCTILQTREAATSGRTSEPKKAASSQSPLAGTPGNSAFTTPKKDIQVGTARESFQCRRRGDILTIPVHIAGHAFRFILDTGAQVTIVDQRLRQWLHDTERELPLSDGNRAVSRRLYALPEHSRVGQSLELNSIPFVLCHDFGAIRDAFGVQFDGVLGCDFLSSKQFQVDFENGIITFFGRLDRSTVPLGQQAFLGQNGNRQPTIPIVIGDGPAFPFVVDTGALAISMQLDHLTYSFFEGNGELTSQDRVEVLAAHGSTMERGGVVARASLTGHTLHDVTTQTGPYNFIGLDFLSRFTVTFDFANDRAYFQPNRQFGEQPDQNATGARLGRTNDTFLVEGVESNSIAWQSGLREGDVVTSVNGRDTREITLIDMRTICTMKEPRVRMTVKRKGGTADIHLKARADQTHKGN
jgi:hypothetical protein